MGHQPSAVLRFRASGGAQSAPRCEVPSARGPLRPRSLSARGPLRPPLRRGTPSLAACRARAGPHPSGWAGPQGWSLRVGPWGAGGLDHARAARSAQTGNLRPKGCAVSSGDRGCGPRSPIFRPRARGLSVPPSVSRPSGAGGARGRGRPDSGSPTRHSCGKLCGNCKQAEGPEGTLSALLTCQRRAGPRGLGAEPRIYNTSSGPPEEAAPALRHPPRIPSPTRVRPTFPSGFPLPPEREQSRRLRVPLYLPLPGIPGF